MKLLLLADVVDLGKKGEIVEVKPGFARNFLIPQKLAKAATEEVEQEAVKEAQESESKKEQELKDKEKEVQEIDKLTLKFKEKTSDKGKIFGSINEKRIVEEINKKLNIKISSKQIVLSEHIKKTGKYLVDVNLAPNLSAKLKIEVLAK